ncbi:DUF2567 domain-containing protein [Micromonospora halotolerans]|uniref:DUF2567 domain-containing protein n=1 Tax=Micromonospora halotolerans TaxID=709879 RepID=A0ABY9ZQS3_9ACTN|nr:DUF2567 domain-containing protein [Micromonospora halotolerans]WNM37633.1 DUF2567 domain-containing protein [Micromonospora halotolerans]
MSPDTPDSERAAEGPGAPGDVARPPAGAGSSPRPDRPTNSAPPDGSPGEGASPGPSPATRAAPDRAPVEGEAPAWPGGLPVPAGTPVTAPGADPLAGYPGVVGAVPGAPSATRRSGGRAVAVALGAALLLTVLGAPLGVLWALVAPGTPVQMTPDGAVYATPQPEQPIAADGWFSLLGLGFGVLAAIALWVVLRRRRGPVGLVAGALGGLGAAVVAWQVGRRIGLGTYQRLLDTAPPGTDFTKPADLRAGGIDWYGPLPVPHGNLLLAAFGAAVTYTLLAGWSRWPSLRPEPEWDGGWAPGGPGISSAPGDQPAR